MGQDSKIDILELANDHKKLEALVKEHQILSDQKTLYEAAQERIATATNRLNDAMANLDDGFVLFDAEDRLVACNNAFRTQYGEIGQSIEAGDTYEELTTRLAHSGLIPDIQDKETQFVNDLIEKRRSGIGIEKTFQTHDGKWIRQCDKLTPSGELVGLRTDVTELKQREMESQEASQLLQETTQAMAQGLIVLDDKNIRFLNPMARELLDIPEHIFRVGLPWHDFFMYQVKRGDFGEGETGNEFYSNVANNFQNGQIEHVERKGANGRDLLSDRFPNSLGGLTIMLTDITAIKSREKLLEKARRESEEASSMLDEAINAMPQGMMIHDQDVIQRSNFDLHKMLSLPPELVMPGSSLRAFAKYCLERGDEGHGIDVGAALKLSDEMCGRNEAFSLERILPDGRIIVVNVEPRKNGGMVSTYTDVTEDRKREQELEKARVEAESAELAKSEFLANMSHEIRTPMNGVMGMAELLATTNLDAKQKMFTDVIVKSGASLLTIINDILDFSKIDAGQMELDTAPFILADAIEDVATLVSAKVAEKDLELIVRIDPKLPQMMVGDVGRIRQIVTNLLGNAVKFTEQGHVYVNVSGEVTNGSSGKIAGLRFQVEDTGIGIPKEKCDQIFTKFSQVDASATRKHEGTGLGLSIASSLVELMGGTIGVESQAGSGSNFWFNIDLPVHGEISSVKKIPIDVSDASVLIIDDNQVNRAILSEQMNAWGFDSAATTSGLEGLQVIRTAQKNNLNIDLVILDYQMPGMSGEEVLSEIRNDTSIKDLPVIMLTSVDSSKANQTLTRLGVNANLTKPTRSSMLLETILQVITDHRAFMRQKADVATLQAIGQHKEPIEEETIDVLVAEDNEVNQIVFRQVLEETGLKFKIVENGRLALSHYKIRSPKMILMDVSMPEMNGKEATRAIRKFETEHGHTKTPIIGVTAHALKGDMEACIDAGMDDYLAKPISPSKLTAKIEQWLKVDLDDQKLA